MLNLIVIFIEVFTKSLPAVAIEDGIFESKIRILMCYLAYYNIKLHHRFLSLYLVTLLLSNTSASNIKATLKDSNHGFQRKD